MKHRLGSIAILAALVTGCVIQFEPSPDRHYHLSISVGYTEAQANTIINAAIEWQNATGGYITFDGAGHPGDNETIDFVTEKERQPDPPLEGETWNEGTSSTVSIYSTLDSATFKQTATHELGHAIGLQHAESGTIMCAGAWCAAKHVTCGDVKQLCSVWGCDASGMPACTTK